MALMEFASAQEIIRPRIPGGRTNPRERNSPNTNQTQQTTSDTTRGFKRRNDAADSITITFRLLDSLRSTPLDTSIGDIHNYLPLPAHYVTLGNVGSPAYPILFTPVATPGWDPGFHQFDPYKYTFQNTRFFRTTRPFTQLSYQLASGKEQIVNVLHTQNVNRNWNFGFEYRLISSPGFFKTQNTNHNNYRLFSNYTGVRKRYSAYFILLGNKLAASENGGVVNVADLDNPNNNRRFTINTRLGGDAAFFYNVFTTRINTGNVYREMGAFFRQSYDLGKRDSVRVNDSTMDYLFYPKLRFQHTITYQSLKYQFTDKQSGSNATADSSYFKTYYDTTLDIGDGLSFLVEDRWRLITNDFILQQFPETKNPAQFIAAGARLENFNGAFAQGNRKFHNVILLGEYRNKTRNRKWDASLDGSFYVNGFNSGDFHVAASLARTLGTKLGDIRLSFRNVNRTPSYIFEPTSSFSFKDHPSLKKENITFISASAENPYFQLWFRNISITNLTYFKNYYHAEQYNKLVNVVQVQGSKAFRLARNLRLYSDVIVQQTDNASPVRVPLVYTRQRLAWEGVYFKNMVYSFGFDVRYNTPYKAYDYSPVMGQFVPQDTVTISNTPFVAAFFNFRIKTFSAFTRAENLNAIRFEDGLQFTNNNLAAPNYAYPGLVIRIGVRWRFVN
jgi:hypothetical protein